MLILVWFYEDFFTSEKGRNRSQKCWSSWSNSTILSFFKRCVNNYRILQGNDWDTVNFYSKQSFCNQATCGINASKISDTVELLLVFFSGIRHVLPDEIWFAFLLYT